MPINLKKCPNLTIFFTIILLFISFIPQHCNAQKDKKNTEPLSATVFKFIYNNERLCGDMFANSTWLPAHQNCELKCRMDSEICQMSGDNVLIRRQRCHQLPVECRRRLKQLLGGAELYTKPKRGSASHFNMPPRLLAKESQRVATGSIYSSSSMAMANKGNRNKSNGVLSSEAARDPVGYHVVPKSSPSLLSTSTISSLPRQIPHVSLNGRRPLSPELVPLSHDNEILIPPIQLHQITTTISSSISSNSTSSQLKAIVPGGIGTKKRGPRPAAVQLPTQNRQHSKPQPQSKIIAIKHSSITNGVVKEKVDDSLQLAYQNLYMMETQQSTTAADVTTKATTGGWTKASGIMTMMPLPLPSSPVGTATLTSTNSLHGIPQGQSAEWKSSELGHPFVGNPFGNTEMDVLSNGSLSVLSAPLLTQLHSLPLPITSAELGIINSQQQVEQRQYELFGPPINAIKPQFDQIGNKSAAAAHQSQSQSHVQIHPLIPSGIQPSGYLPQLLPQYSSTSHSQHHQNHIQIKAIGESKQKQNDGGMQKNGGEEGRNKIYQGKSMPWWAWRAFAESIKNKRPSYNTAAGLLTLDKSIRCCQWALDGLCDRSWQRIRELCPKSCGSIVCSSIDGTLSCNRMLNVDVIACYEQRRHSLSEFHHYLAAPIHKIPDDSAQLIAEGLEHFNMPRNDEVKSIEQREFAIEKEITLLALARQRQQQQANVDEFKK